MPIQGNQRRGRRSTSRARVPPIKNHSHKESKNHSTDKTHAQKQKKHKPKASKLVHKLIYSEKDVESKIGCLADKYVFKSKSINTATMKYCYAMAQAHQTPMEFKQSKQTAIKKFHENNYILNPSLNKPTNPPRALDIDDSEFGRKTPKNMDAWAEFQHSEQAIFYETLYGLLHDFFDFSHKSTIGVTEIASENKKIYQGYCDAKKKIIKAYRIQLDNMKIAKLDKKSEHFSGLLEDETRTEESKKRIQINLQRFNREIETLKKHVRQLSGNAQNDMEREVEDASNSQEIEETTGEDDQTDPQEFIGKGRNSLWGSSSFRSQARVGDLSLKYR